MNFFIPYKLWVKQYHYWSSTRITLAFNKSRVTWVQSQVKSYQRLKKMVHNASLLQTQKYKAEIKGKVDQSRERSSALPYTKV